jgi:hypothetical protein
MERRHQVASALHDLMDRPMGDAEKEFWRELDSNLATDRPKFR